MTPMKPTAAGRLRGLADETFAALGTPNYRRYVAGQVPSLVGNWMQVVTQSWLVLQITGSGTAIGLVVALQMLPILLLGPYAGVVADRLDKRRLLIALQGLLCLQALLLGVLVLTDTVALWHVYALAAMLGVGTAFENPARQAFVLEMVGRDHLRNAVSLYSVLVNVARFLGPAAAGLIIGAGGTGLCFLVNAASFGAVVVSLLTLDVAALAPSEPTPRGRGQLREGLRYVRRSPSLATPLVMMAIVGCFAYEFPVVLPIVASDTFGGDARTYGFMTSAMGAGAVVGGLWVAGRGRTGVRALTGASVVFGGLMVVAALAPTLWIELVALVLLGAASVGFLAKSNSTLQLAALPHMRGRVMALWSVALLGSTPIGGPIAGAVAERLGGRAGLLLGAAGCLVAAGIGLVALRAEARAQEAQAPAEPNADAAPAGCPGRAGREAADPA